MGCKRIKSLMQKLGAAVVLTFTAEGKRNNCACCQCDQGYDVVLKLLTEH
uniref:Uncharacterized protein n=1 Tax=Octopus bimaculoides TaxID=37653 RepID=A0A0L8I9Y0_OCTBM